MSGNGLDRNIRWRQIAMVLRHSFEHLEILIKIRKDLHEKQRHEFYKEVQRFKRRFGNLGVWHAKERIISFLSKREILLQSSEPKVCRFAISLEEFTVIRAPLVVSLNVTELLSTMRMAPAVLTTEPGCENTTLENDCV